MNRKVTETETKTHLRNMIREDVTDTIGHNTDPRTAANAADAANTEALLNTVQRLQHWQTPTVSPQATRNLIDLLAEELPVALITPERSRVDRIWNSWAVLLLRSQIRVVQRELWIASALVMALGTIVTMAANASEVNSGMVPLVLLAPVVTAVGIAFVYGPLNDPALEIELAAPLSPRLIALTRITLVFCFNFVFGVIGSAVLVFSGSGVTFIPLVAAWLAPMAFLSSLAFLLSVIFFDPLTSALFSGVLWVMMNMRHLVQWEMPPLFQWIPNLLSADARPLIWLMAVILMGTALWLLGQDERWMGAQN